MLDAVARADRLDVELVDTRARADHLDVELVDERARADRAEERLAEWDMFRQRSGVRMFLKLASVRERLAPPASRRDAIVVQPWLGSLTPLTGRLLVRPRPMRNSPSCSSRAARGMRCGTGEHIRPNNFDCSARRWRWRSMVKSICWRRLTATGFSSSTVSRGT